MHFLSPQALYYYYYHCIFVFNYLLCVLFHMPRYACLARGQLAGVGSLLPLVTPGDQTLDFNHGGHCLSYRAASVTPHKL